MRILSFNVNGLRGFSSKLDVSFEEFLLSTLEADIICLQEIKGTRAALGMFHSLKNYYTLSSFYEKKGRHGVATLHKKTIACCGHTEILKGRILRTEHNGFTLYNCYMPYCKEDGADKSHIIEVYTKLTSAIADNSKAIVCGDFNACYNMVDHYQFCSELSRLGQAPKLFEHSGKALLPNDVEFPNAECIERGEHSQRVLPYTFLSYDMLERYFFRIQQRRWLYAFAAEFIDTFRFFNKSIDTYTCWNTVLRNRPVNLGTRIDYIFCSPDLSCEAAGTMPSIYGSDHCPVYAEFDFKVEEESPSKVKNNIFDYLKKTQKPS